MRYAKLMLAAVAATAVLAWACQTGTKENQASNEPIVKGVLTKDEAIKRGSVLVTAGGCNDCHSPKNFSPQGMEIDTSRFLSGHPANSPLPPVTASALKPGGWVLMAPDITAFAGPWGMSFAANLTPDSATGLGTWTEQQFIQTMRTGKHMGMANGRPLLPPMPWFNLAQLPDEELKSIFAYLQSLPPVNNRVPGPIAPDKLAVK